MTEVKPIVQVKVIRTSSSEDFEKQINEFCEFHDVTQINYGGISHAGTYSCMIVYIARKEYEIGEDDLNTHAAMDRLVDSIRGQTEFVEA